MKQQFRLVGHGWRREVSRTQGEIYDTFSMPGGGALVDAMLNEEEGELLPQEPVLVEHLSIATGKKGELTDRRLMGFTKGNSLIDSGRGEIAVVWDEGLEPFTVPDKLPVLWTSCRRLPPPDLFLPIRNRCLLLIPADLLREAGALISKQMSWERTATDLVWQLQHNPLFSYLRGVPELLVPFGEDGIVHIRHREGSWDATLTLADGGFEGQRRESCGAQLLDSWAVMVASAALCWRRQLEDQVPLEASGLILPAYRLMEDGFPVEAAWRGDYSGWQTAESDSSHAFPIPLSDSEQTADPHYWCISSSFQNTRLQELARQYVLEGSSVIRGIPRFSCGALTTVDGREIEAFGNLRNLIVGYAASKAARPLSIAVFGAPGSGKSFGVTQIAKNVLPGVEKLEFNVSQMSGPEDLSAAFHQVRDAVLRGKLPLVFFDEFDSDRDGRLLGWLKSFLMPMQDGKFKDASGEHPVGKCIMVFAGGTSSSFEEFCRPMKGDDPVMHQKFKDVKGPDFVSRLRGTINVLGPNPAGKGEQNYILRRALLLRSLLERKLSTEAVGERISEDVLRAMLLVPRYKHGARSMESVLDMSRLEGGLWNPASLPFYTQLSLHVDADAFLRLVLNEVILNAYNEHLAKAIHEDFLAKEIHENYRSAEETAISHLPWEELPEELKDANRTQALDIPTKLLHIRCCFDAGDTPYPSVEAFTPEEVLYLAQHEHQRWMMDKASRGWVYGPVRDNDKKIHPDMVSWEDLPEAERQKDVNVVNNIIPLLKKAGLRVYRMV